MIGRAGPFVEGDQVDLGGDTRDQLDQTPRIFVAVVHILKHHVFKGDSLGIAGLGIGAQRIEQFRDVPALVDRHKFVTHRICGGVKADGQHATDLIGGARDLGHHARGRQRDPPTAQRDALAIHGDLHRVAHIVEIIKRLTHAHQHDVRDQPWPLAHAFAGFGPFAKIVARHHDLTNNLACGQVAHQFLCAGMAERTSQRATHLAGNAQRAAIHLGDIDDLDFMAARDAHKVFPRSIGRDIAAHHFGDLDHEMLGQFGAIALGQIGHDVEITRTPDIKPLPDLGDPHLGLLLRGSRRDQRRAHPIARQPNQVNRPFGQLARNGQNILRDRRRGGHGRIPLWTRAKYRHCPPLQRGLQSC